jgi:hypothetical protein
VTTVRTVETVAGLIPVALATEASLMPAAETWIERLGVAAVLVVVGYFLLRWFMAQSEKKDDLILKITQEHAALVSKLTAEHAASQREGNAMIMREIQSGHEVKRQVAIALDRLTAVIGERE